MVSTVVYVRSIPTSSSASLPSPVYNPLVSEPYFDVSSHLAVFREDEFDAHLPAFERIAMTSNVPC